MRTKRCLERALLVCGLAFLAVYLGLRVDGALQLRARLRSFHFLDQHRALASATEITGELPPPSPTPDIQLAGPDWFQVMR